MSGFSEHDDTTLARLALAGELAAFDELARRYQSPLLRFVSRRLPDSDAEDVVQETLVKAYTRLGQYRPSYAFKNWVFAIAYHETIDHLRRPRKPVNAVLGEIPIDADPGREAEVAERNASLWSIARSELSDDAFTAVWLFYVEDMTAADIALVQRRSWISVKVMLHRARAKLADCLNAESMLDGVEPVKIIEAGEP